MAQDQKKGDGESRGRANRMPSNSIFYEKIVPILLIGLAILVVAIILLTAAVLLGIL